MNRRTLLEPSPFASDGGNLIGRDPRDVSAGEWRASGLPLAVGLAAIRAKCLDCAENAAEVRKCVQTACALWPLRMRMQPAGLAEARGVARRAVDGAPRLAEIDGASRAMEMAPGDDAGQNGLHSPK
jgi:hypothetical protein